ncbi:MAG: hypothetical protein OEQ53_17485, partial [Saprospiraceae bacterium]|nr:hypothetical protein [Saprospiraceae bacterium]
MRAIKSTQLNVLGWLIQFIHLLFLFTPSLHSQDIEDTSTDLKNRLKNNPITFTGSIAAQIQWNTISGMDQRRDPFHLNLFGHANLNILGVNAPFSLAMADGNTTYNLPSYTFVGISPTYRWAKLHLFRRNMNFSKYTLAGHGFNGVGIELRPGNWRIASMYGTLRKAQIQDFGYRHQLDPHFKRLGYGIKFGYESREDYLHLTLFKAEDDPTSLTFGDTTGIAAKDNIVLSTQVKKKISKVLGIEGEYAYSIYTPEKSFLPRAYDGIDHLVHSLVTINGSTRSSSAYHFDIYFRPDQLGDFALGYERIAPDFVSLGTMQFQNDFEHFTASYRGKMKRTIGVSARIGIERNNLDGTELESRN